MTDNEQSAKMGGKHLKVKVKVKLKVPLMHAEEKHKERPPSFGRRAK